jgi:hypothetical protein
MCASSGLAADGPTVPLRVCEHHCEPDLHNDDIRVSEEPRSVLIMQSVEPIPNRTAFVFTPARSMSGHVPRYAIFTPSRD